MLRVIFALSLLVSSFSFAQDRRGGERRRDGDLVDRLLRCEQDKRDIESRKNAEIASIQSQLNSCVYEKTRTRMWSCTAGCQGLGNVGFGSGATEAEARANSLRDLGFNCSHHTFDCRQEY